MTLCHILPEGRVIGGARGVMVIVVGNGHCDTSSKMDETDCILHSTIPLGKVWIQLFSLQLWVNSRTNWVLQPWWGNSSKRRKNSKLKPVKLLLKIDLVSYPARGEGLVNRVNRITSTTALLHWGLASVVNKETLYELQNWRFTIKWCLVSYTGHLVSYTGASGGVMVSKLALQTYTSEFESHWVPLSYGLVPHLSKKLSKFPQATALGAGADCFISRQGI